MRRIFWTIFTYGLLSCSLGAQETEGGVDVDVAAAAPAEAKAGEKLVETAALIKQLRPLTQEEIGEELKKWMELLQQEARDLAAIDVELLNAEGDEASSLGAELIVQREDVAAVSERVRAVIDAMEKKGGDPGNARTYVDSVNTLPTPSGFKAWVATIEAWVVSKEGGRKFGMNVVRFLSCVIAAWIVGGILSKLVGATLARLNKTSDLLRRFLVKTVRRVSVFVGLVIGVSYLGVNIGPLMAAIGAAGLVIGLALQGTLSNFASGIMILLYEPYDVGDVVTAGGVTGKVESMTLVSTVFLTPDNQRVVVPNNKIWDDVITNITANDTRRVDLVFGIGYGDDMEKAQSVLEEVIKAHKLVLQEPEPSVKVNELADSSVNFVVRPWAKTSDYWDVYWDLTKAVKERFDAEGISIPFPQSEVHMHQASNG